ncbi:MAG TPA: OB-fold domain-containing protein [Acidimicrobiia bacterium]|jgi:uncharacterized OB-fold protein|nr:OB-fold domain-containing protein [Acidimicrobiia bacterium]
MSDATKDQLVMEHHVALTYEEALTPVLDRYVDALIDGRIIGHKCPSCGRVYVPGKGYCPLCVVETTERDEIEVADTGTVTGFTIVTPVAYYGQEETEPFVWASILLDGSNGTLGGQDVINIPREQVRSGLRVRAVWKPKEQRSGDAVSNRGWGSVASAIDAFEPTGEPDMPREQYEEHIF